MYRYVVQAAVSVMVGVALAASVRAADLTIGFASEPSSLDPHYHQLVPNEMIIRHAFDKLILQDEKQRLYPGLATSWKAIGDTTWEFELRRGVKWHDGTEFTAADVVFTVKRAPNVPNSPGGYSTYLNQIKQSRIIDPYTVQFETKDVFPLLPAFLSMVFIIQEKAGDGATTADYNSGEALVGTGPYRFVEWVRGDRIVFQRNPDYWGEKEPWDRLIIKPITSGPARVAALLAGDVDLIDQVPPADVANLRKNANVNVVQTPSLQIILLNLAQKSDVWPHITANDGSPLKENPLMKLEVRQAISKAINRSAISQRTMDGSAAPAGQMVPEGFFGYNPKLKADSYDPERARELLKTAGYPDGFRITIHGPNDRYINDAKVLQAVAQMLTRSGIKTQVEAMPKSVFFSKANRREFSLFLTGNGGSTGESSSVLRVLFHTYDEGGGHGMMNRGRYSNRELDESLQTALKTIDDGEREKLLQKAMEIGIRELGVIPLHAEAYTWAMRKGLTYVGRTDTHTLGMGARAGN